MWRLVLGFVCVGVCWSGRAAAGDSPHPVEFWREIVRQDYAVPAGNDASMLAFELAGFTGSPDPELRDALGYTITAEWVRRGILVGTDLRALVPVWRRHLCRKEPDAVLGRAFGALNLALAAAVDAQEPFLGDDEYRALLDEALVTLVDERDLRGWDSQVGWVHVTAHVADLLKWLVRSPRLAPADQTRVLEAVARRLETAPEVFTHGEAERLAAVVVALACRDDFDRDTPAVVAKRLAALPDGFVGIAPAPAAYAARRNAVAFLASTHLALSIAGRRDTDMQAHADAFLAALAE